MPELNSHQFHEAWLTYKTPEVQQLAFSLLSPNIIREIPNQLPIQHKFDLHTDQHWQDMYKCYTPRLQQLDLYPDELHQFLNKLKSTRLGLRFERYIWFWLLDHHYHPYHLIAHSLQIIDGARTIGELDFLIQNTETRQVEHWEVALKYYLGEQNLSLKHWYGLNREDTLLTKLMHFTEKQFQFSNVHEHQIDQRFAVMKGQLYLPYHRYTAKIPPWVNTNRRLGFWGNNFPSHHAQYYRLNRHEWLCPNQFIEHAFNSWWTNGLYFSRHKNEYYMYRSTISLKNKFS
ncbi:hypothetical protein B9T31_11380 [Acinetobacter sp. ANC 4558]|uniref:DUF1853 family protein n=1 Tax=Acinetobacter sp. ANC 4558 TaxID=1977876 RepID=UPI000A3579FE|nr:DUF1853 family protein [Acinetobacter sp. ANC 4558]OTG85395.1 hypothetical protein B9T31_11380 [Acinetobacter sp. ANC 4558]